MEGTAVEAPAVENDTARAVVEVDGGGEGAAGVHLGGAVAVGADVGGELSRSQCAAGAVRVRRWRHRPRTWSLGCLQRGRRNGWGPSSVPSLDVGAYSTFVPTTATRPSASCAHLVGDRRGGAARCRRGPALCAWSTWRARRWRSWATSPEGGEQLGEGVAGDLDVAHPGTSRWWPRARRAVGGRGRGRCGRGPTPPARRCRWPVGDPVALGRRWCHRGGRRRCSPPASPMRSEPDGAEIGTAPRWCGWWWGPRWLRLGAPDGHRGGREEDGHRCRLRYRRVRRTSGRRPGPGHRCRRS